jgi:hypothetical protein
VFLPEVGVPRTSWAVAACSDLSFVPDEADRVSVRLGRCRRVAVRRDCCHLRRVGVAPHLKQHTPRLEYIDKRFWKR